jgi:SAM-dependent methyltransferase
MTDMIAEPETGIDEARAGFAGRLLSAVTASFDLAGIYLGDRLGWYRSLVEDGPATPPELARRTGTDARYAREWLEHQAASGILLVDRTTIDPSDPDLARFELPEAHREVLADPESVWFGAATAQGLVGAMAALQWLIEPYRAGNGMPFEAFGPDMREGEARSTRPIYRTLLANWLRAIPAVDERLRGPDARVADLGCGYGESSLALARAYPSVAVEGIDLDRESIDAANALLSDARRSEPDVAARVSFARRDAADPALEGRFDVVTMFEMFHDLAQPVAVLRTTRSLLSVGGLVLIADEVTSEAFEGPANEVDRRHYGWSMTHCLAAARTHPTSAATGTMLRPSKVRSYAAEAGFGNVEIASAGDDVFRIYVLRP